MLSDYSPRHSHGHADGAAPAGGSLSLPARLDEARSPAELLADGAPPEADEQRVAAAAAAAAAAGSCRKEEEEEEEEALGDGADAEAGAGGATAPGPGELDGPASQMAEPGAER